MGLLSGLFGSNNSDERKAKGILAKQVKLTAEEKADADALKLEQEENRLSLKQRKRGLRGGGREGLMYGGNQQGVVNV